MSGFPHDWQFMTRLTATALVRVLMTAIVVGAFGAHAVSTQEPKEV
jgi:hypothetical protein